MDILKLAFLLSNYDPTYLYGVEYNIETLLVTREPCIHSTVSKIFTPRFRAAQCGAPSDSTSARTADAGEVPLAPDAVRGRGAPIARSRALGGAWGAAPRAAPSAARRGGGAGLGHRGGAVWRAERQHERAHGGRRRDPAGP